MSSAHTATSLLLVQGCVSACAYVCVCVLDAWEVTVVVLARVERGCENVVACIQTPHVPNRVFVYLFVVLVCFSTVLRWCLCVMVCVGGSSATKLPVGLTILQC